MSHEYICIEGNIGVGKTTLAKKLSQHFGYFAFYEEFEENPWLPAFYKDPKAMALSLELSFLTDRVRQLNRIQKEHGGKPWISDYCLDKCLLFAEANLEKEDLLQYKTLHAAVSANLPKPSLVIVIHSSAEELQKNIRTRNRSYEQEMQKAYLETLNKTYTVHFKEERAYSILNIFSPKLDEAAYERIFDEISAFVKLKHAAKNTSLEI